MKSLHKSQQIFILKGFVLHVLCARLINTAVIYFCNFFFVTDLVAEKVPCLVSTTLMRGRRRYYFNIFLCEIAFDEPAVSSVAKRTLSVREVLGSIPGPVKSAQCRQRLATVAAFLRSCVAQALSRGDGPRNSLHASA